MIEFRALGSLGVTIDGRDAAVGGSRQRRLLAMLLIHRDSVVSVDRLADAVFAGEPTSAANTTMRSYIARIRKVLEPGGPEVAVTTQAPGYVLRAPADAVDTARFEQLLATGERQLALGDAVSSASSIRSALHMWTGDAYAEFADEEWVLPEAQRLEELRVAAHERLIEAELACGRAVEAIAILESLIAAHPVRETFRTQLMLALYRSGRQVDALRVHREYRQYLVDEVGLDPSPAVGDLAQRILEHDPSLLLMEPAGTPLLGYRLGARLGVGPNGTVHAARVPGLDQEFAISVLTDDRVDHPDFVQTFEANARMISSLHHAAIVPLHDVWREPGSAFVVTRRVTGPSLRDRLERGDLAVDEFATIVVRIGDALAHAEQRKVQHGWITLDNVVFDDSGAACVTNFVISPERGGTDVADLASMIEQVLAHVPTMPTDCRRLIGDAVRTAQEIPRGVPDKAPVAGFVTELRTALSEISGGRAADELGADRPNPYQGLRAFDEMDGDRFFGREELVSELLDRLGGRAESSRFILLVGGSGSGKSSVVRAGVLPALRAGAITGSEHWLVTTMLPGSAPFKELAEGLRRVAVTESPDLADELANGSITLVEAANRVLPGDQPLVLFIDQFEELFTLAPEGEQRQFLDCLATAVTSTGRLRIVTTLRADFYDRPLAFQGFGELAGDATVAVAAMSASSIDAAIVRPLASIGATAEPALVSELVNAIADQPSALPSLQFTLFELAERRGDRCLRLDDYRQLGGVDAAIAGRAETLYRGMNGEGRDTIRRVFEQLVVIGADGETTSRRSARARLIRQGESATDAVIERWISARLLTGDIDPRTRVPTVQVAHEALLRSWPRLAEWIDADRDQIITLGNLQQAAQAWADTDRDEDTLYRGARLTNALDVVDRSADQLPAVESAFLAASLELRDRADHEAAERAHGQARTNRRLRRQLGAIAVALAVALVGGFVALDQRSEATGQRRVAFARELASSSVAALDEDADRSLLLGLAAVDEARTGAEAALPEAVTALHRAVGVSRVVLTVPDIGGSLDWSPRGDVFVTEGPEESGMIELRSTTTGESIRSWKADAVDVNEVRFNPDGSALLVAGDSGAALWDPDTGSELVRLEGEGFAWNPSFSADGTMVLTRWTPDGVIRLHDARTGALVQEVEANVLTIRISPDGTRAAVGLGLGQDPYGLVADGSGEPLFALEGVDHPVTAIEWSPDGRKIAAGLGDGTVQIFDGATGQLESTGSGHLSSVFGLDWSPDSRRVVSGSNDGSVRVWEVDGDTLTSMYRLVAAELASGVPGVSFSPDGTRVLAGDWGINAAKIFDLDIGATAEWLNVAASPWQDSMSFTTSGDGLYLGSETTPSALWNINAKTSSTPSIGNADDSLYFVSLSPDGEHAAMKYDDGSVSGLRIEIWNVASGVREGAWTPSGTDRRINFLRWSPDSSAAAIVHWNGSSWLLSLIDRSGTILADYEDPTMYFQDVAFVPDGSTLVIAPAALERPDPTTDVPIVWDWSSDEVVETFGGSTIEFVDVDDTGTRLLGTVLRGSTTEILDLATGDKLVELVGHNGLLTSAAFMPGSEQVLTTSADGTARIWDAETGRELVMLDAGQAIVDAAVSNDGRRVATVDTDGLVRVWAMELDDLVAIATERVTRPLTDAECRAFLHLDACSV